MRLILAELSRTDAAAAAATADADAAVPGGGGDSDMMIPTLKSPKLSKVKSDGDDL